ncbi:MAG: diaminopimelate decarboxylase [Thermodesulfobacteriota bacterium]|nr:diaminopimelate decarboxylase [Thermodesulfobacteriota bacterium]
MHHFEYRNGELYAEEVRVMDLAKEFGTPLYVYSTATFKRHFQIFDSALEGLEHLTCYSIKVNSNLSVIKLLAGLDAGMDIVSGGELYRALACGVSPEKIVYSGVGKRPEEIKEALLAGILMFNVESLQELEKINEIALGLGKKARISIRINPDVDPKTHPYISTGLKENKFGLDQIQALEAYKAAMEMPGVEPVGIDCHIGSQLTEMGPFLEALDKVLQFYKQLKGMGLAIRYLDLGGGLGIRYHEEEPPHPEQFGEALVERLQGLPLTLILEPGRVIAGNAGILVTRVLYTKDTPSKHFVIVDAAMTELVRPSFYGSYHYIAEVTTHQRTPIKADVVGPVCESSDFLAQDRALPQMYAGECLAVFSAGAYGFAMGSQYNSRPRPAEILVDRDKITVARRRETYEDLVALER